MPFKEEEILKIQSESITKLLKKFKGKALGENSQGFKAQLKQKLRERSRNYLEKNERVSQDKAQIELETWWLTIQDQLKNNEITTFSQLKNKIDAFSKAFRVEAITKAVEITLLEYIIQSYSESAEYLSRASLTELQNETRRLGQQLEYSQEQSNRRRTEFEQEKNYLKNRIEEYERELCNVKASQATSTSRIEDLTREKKRIEESYEERIQYIKENTTEKIEDLKAKYQDSSEKLNSLQTSSSKQIVDLQRDNALLRQELEFKKNEEIEFKRRREEAESDIRDLRNKLRNAQDEVESKQAGKNKNNQENIEVNGE